MFPLPSALLIKIGAALALCAVMYFMGWSHEHKKFVKFQAEVAALGKAQEQINAQKVKEHETISTSIKDEYEGKLAAVHNYYSERMQRDTSSSNVPAVSKPAQCVNVSAPDAGLARRCAQTTLQLTELQKWVRSVTNAK
jgi:hypothetical protein